MFTWECPKCGREVDIAEESCPHCPVEAKPEPGQGGAAAAPPAARLPEPAQPARAERLLESEKPASAFALSGKQIGIVLGALLAAVVAAVFLSQPDLLRFEDVAEGEAPAALGPAGVGPVEVAGVRLWYGEGYKPKVRAIVINHSDRPQRNIDFEVSLRPKEAPPDAPPLARFELRLSEELAPNASREIEADLEAAGTLASMPDWRDLRVDVEAR